MKKYLIALSLLLAPASAFALGPDRGSAVQPAQILSGGASANQVMTWNGTKWAPAAASSGVATSSTVANGLPQISITATAFGPCIAGSTLTITTTGGPVMMSFSATVQNGNLQANTVVGVLMDGAFLGGETTAIGYWSAMTAIINTGGPVGGITYTRTAPSAAAHSFCVVVRVDQGTSSFSTGLISPSWSVQETK